MIFPVPAQTGLCVTQSLVGQGKEFRVGFCKTVNIAHLGKTVGGHDSVTAGAQTVIVHARFPDHIVAPGLTPFVPPGHGGAAGDGAYTGNDLTGEEVRCFCNVSGRDLQFGAYRNDCSQFSRKVEADSGKAFKKMVNGVKSSPFPFAPAPCFTDGICFGIIPPRQINIVGEHTDNKSVPGNGFQRKSGFVQKLFTEKDIDLSRLRSGNDRDLHAGTFLEKCPQFIGGKAQDLSRSGGKHDHCFGTAFAGKRKEFPGSDFFSMDPFGSKTSAENKRKTQCKSDKKVLKIHYSVLKKNQLAVIMIPPAL